MGEFLDAALAFPVVLFSFALLVVVAYWLVALLGGAGLDALDADVDTDAGADGGFVGFLGALGLGGVPVTVALSLLTVLAWFVSLVGAVLLDRAGLPTAVWLLGAVGVLVIALLLAWLGTGLVIRPLRRVFVAEPAPSRTDFVGRLCVIRTGRVGPDFGQAEVTAPDGSSAVVQVRLSEQDGADPDRLRAGSTALIFDYDAAGEFFWVTAYDDAGTDPSLHPSG